MRILFLNQYLPPDAAATARLLADLAEDLAPKHEIWVIAGRPSYNPDVAAFAAQSVKVLRVRSTTMPRTTMSGRALNYLSFLAGALVRVWSVPRPDLVVTMTDPPVIGFIGALAAKRHRVPFTQIYMDLYPDVAIALGKANNRLLVSVWRRLNRFVRRTADCIVTVGRDMGERLVDQGTPADKIVFRPNWADDLPEDPEATKTVRNAMGWDERYVVMFAGNVGLAQGLDVMIDAAARLRNHPEVRFVVLGSGAAKQRLEDKVRSFGLSNVSFVSHQPHDQAQALVAAADLHVISLADGLLGTASPSKVYEIMAAGKPFVAAVERGSEIDLLLSEHGCGVRVNPGDGEAMAEAILAVLTDDNGEMGRRGREAFEVHYTRTIATDAYRELLEAVASNGAGAMTYRRG